MTSGDAVTLWVWALWLNCAFCSQIWRWWTKSALPVVEGDMPPPELVRCETCGRKYILGGRHPINNCEGPKPSDPQFSAKRRRW